jgi:hypothetical protein
LINITEHRAPHPRYTQGQDPRTWVHSAAPPPIPPSCLPSLHSRSAHTSLLSGSLQQISAKQSQKSLMGQVFPDAPHGPLFLPSLISPQLVTTLSDLCPCFCVSTEFPGFSSLSVFVGVSEPGVWYLLDKNLQRHKCGSGACSGPETLEWVPNLTLRAEEATPSPQAGEPVVFLLLRSC